MTALLGDVLVNVCVAVAVADHVVAARTHSMLRMHTGHVWRTDSPLLHHWQGGHQGKQAYRGAPHLLMLVLPPFHPLFCTLLRKQNPGHQSLMLAAQHANSALRQGAGAAAKGRQKGRRTCC